MTATLAEQARTIEHPLPVPGVSGLWGLELDGRSFQVSQAQLDQIRAGFVREMRRGLRRADVTIVSGSEGHRYMRDLRQDQYIVSRISDTLGGVSFPALSIWESATQAAARARAELDASQFTDSSRDLEIAQVSAQAAMQQYIEYREGTITGAGRSVTTLEWTRDISFAVAGILATVATGGTGGLLIGTAISASGNVAQQAMEVHLDMRREVDWRGIGLDAAIGLVVGALGGRIAGAQSLRWFFESPAGASLGRAVVQRVATNLLLGRFQAMLQTSMRAAVDNLAGERNAMTGEQLVDTLVAQFTDPRGLFMDALSGELSRQVAAANVARTRSNRGSGEHQQQQAPPPRELSSGGESTGVRVDAGADTPSVRADATADTTTSVRESVAPAADAAEPLPASREAEPVSASREPVTTTAEPLASVAQPPRATADLTPAPTPVTTTAELVAPTPRPAPRLARRAARRTAATEQIEPAATPPPARASRADGTFALPAGVPRGRLRTRAVELINQLPPAERALVADAVARMSPEAAGEHLSNIGRMESAGALSRLLQTGLQRVTGRTPEAGGEFASREQLDQHRAEVAGEILDTPDGRARVPDDSTAPPPETAEPLEGLSTIERRPPARIDPETPGVDRSELRRRMDPPAWAGENGRAWEAHHVIPIELQNHPVFEVLRRSGGWDHNAASNGIALPARPGIPGAEAAGLPVHQVNREVIAAAREPVNQSRRQQGLPEIPMPDAQTMRDLQGHPVTNERVRQALDQLAARNLSPDVLRAEVARLQQQLILDMGGGGSGVQF